VVTGQTIYVNGKMVASNLGRNDSQSFKLDNSTLQKGKNEFVVVGKRFKKRSEWDEPNTNPGILQVVVPAESWKRKAFNGLAQVIVQSTQQLGEIVLKASAPELAPAVLKIKAEQTILRAAVK
jgi:beta-galactosidase